MTIHGVTTSSFVVRGGVERGDRRGRTIGFPTVNVAIERADVLDGVWAGWIDLRAVRRPAAISVGSRPTFYGRNGYRLLEAHILDFDDECYDEIVTVWLCHRLRDQVRFDGVDELVAQLERDIAATAAWATAATDDVPDVRHVLADAPFGRPLPLHIAA